MYPLREKIHAICIESGIDAFGVADPSLLKSPYGISPVDLLPNTRSVVVFGKAIPHESYCSPDTYTEVAFRYFELLDSLSRKIAGFLEANGEHAFPVGSNRPVLFRNRRFIGILSLKHAAEKSGLGTIGRNTLLLSRQFGPRLRLGGLLTTADLGYDSPLKKQVCIKGCSICIEKCPHQALNGNGIDFYRCLTKAHGHPFMFLTAVPRGFRN